MLSEQSQVKKRSITRAILDLIMNHSETISIYLGM